jgi:hypothetical protein
MRSWGFAGHPTIIQQHLSRELPLLTIVSHDGLRISNDSSSVCNDNCSIYNDSLSRRYHNLNVAYYARAFVTTASPSITTA